MAFNPTPEQEKIINARNTSLLVSAAAGSGKTAVLVERIVSIVCDEKDPTDIDRILVVTFTQSAAAEMKERILKRINEKLDEDPDNENLRRQTTLVHRALITTIDSFCLDVIRNHFGDADIDPDFRVCDEGEAHLIRMDVLSRTLEKAYENADPDFLNCVESFCPGNNDSTLEDIILSLSNVADSYPWPLEYLEERKKDHSIKSKDEFKGSDIEKAVLCTVRAFCESAIRITERAIRVCEHNPEIENYLPALSSDRDLFESLLKVICAGDYENVYEKITGLSDGKEKLKAIKKTGDSETDEIVEALKKEIQNYRKLSWGEIDKAIQRYFSFTLTEYVEMIKGCENNLNALLDVVMDFKREYAAEKKKRHTVDFSDLSHFALDILTTHKVKDGVVIVEPTDAAIEYRSRFVQVMTDEYQDSNLVQERILDAVSGDRIGLHDRFIVGDVKQSIYGFRQARPDLFVEKQKQYTSVPPFMEVDLSGNFRSRTQVIDSVNRVFERIMHEDICDIEYDDSASLKAKATYPENEECRTELILYDNKMMENMAEEFASAFNEAGGEGREQAFDPLAFMDDASDKSELEALIVGSKIKELMNKCLVTENTESGQKLRKISYRDIVILRRSVGGVTETYRKVFASMGIPFYAEGKNGYFKAREISLLLQYLRVLSNPLDDIPLYAVMHSVFGGFDENEIALIRCGRKGKSLYDSLLCASGRYEDVKGADPLTPVLKEKLNAFLDEIDEYRKMSGFLTVRQLLDRIMSDFNYSEICRALPGGSGRIANVEMLLVMASNYEKSSYLGLNDFIRYIDNMEKFEVDSGEVGSASEAADVVRLMTVHKSKGLEFPYVIFAGMGRGFNFTDLNMPILADDTLGLGCRFTDLTKRARIKTLRQCAISDKIRRNLISEEMRLFYVAMTRAREKLVMVGGLKDPEKELEKRMDLPSERLSLGEFQSATCYLDLLLPVLGCREVLDTMDVMIENAERLYHERKKEEESLAFGHSEFMQVRGGDLSLADKELYEKLKEKFSYVYPYGYYENLYSKTTVSELKMAAMAEKDEGAYEKMEHGEDETARPVFAGGNTSRIYDDPEETERESGSGASDDLHASDTKSSGKRTSDFVISGTERGNAYHRIMQLLSWDRILGPVFDAPAENYEDYSRKLKAAGNAVIESINAFLDEEEKAGHISEKTHVAVSPYKILTFLGSELSFRMWQADKKGLLKKEQPFVYGIPASRLLDPVHRQSGSEALDNELLMIQGIIDAYFIEDGKIILLDYKTDVVKDMDELWKRYEKQMDYYKEALESLEGMAVCERHLYSFKLGKASPDRRI